MKVIKDRQIVEDAWHLVGRRRAGGRPCDRQPRALERRARALPAAGTGRRGAAQRPSRPTTSPTATACRSIAVDFPAFTDGRGYSSARMLRSRLGYKGEIRAVGDVMRDQMFLMSRCGIDSFAVKASKDIEKALGAFDDFSVTLPGRGRRRAAAVPARAPLTRLCRKSGCSLAETPLWVAVARWYKAGVFTGVETGGALCFRAAVVRS